ncbi:MAG: hypothetical protein Q9187_008176 [Circinaria calcarea]
MPLSVYQPLREKYIALLSTLYTQVASPIDAPEKKSHGDIDILVSIPLSTDPSPASLCVALDATDTVKNGGSRSYAVPYPGSASDHVQLDVSVCPAHKFRWELFTHSHGDLWNLLGTSIRPFGLTANDQGLHLRIREIEDVDRKKSLLHLTSDPGSVLEFLGLDPERYWRPFGTVDELYRYAAGMRLFRRDTYLRETLKANDRKRMVQRPLYRDFVAEWLPQRPELGVGVEWNPSLRVNVLEEALEVYGKRDEYHEKIETWRKNLAEMQTKQEANNLRRARIKEEIEYADAWIGTWTRNLVREVK